MTRQVLVQHILDRKSFLCVGLDPDPTRLPKHLPHTTESIASFCTQIIDATLPYCVAYKPNFAFFEAFGLAGYQALELVMDYIPDTHLTIADAKRGDIGNTARQYAKATFDQLGADAITVAPYMGRDSVTPFLEWTDKWVILLAATSNAGAQDFQFIEDANGTPLYQRVLKTASDWATPEQLMFVVGATRPELLGDIRRIIPDHFLLVPGVGAQGGSLAEVCRY
ncbi:MAG: orotidine-5'-phosphate decarboxylase, partial [Bacteroidota bacterium]